MLVAQLAEKKAYKWANLKQQSVQAMVLVMVMVTELVMVTLMVQLWAR
jgi:hypothetical protein